MEICTKELCKLCVYFQLYGDLHKWNLCLLPTLWRFAQMNFLNFVFMKWEFVCCVTRWGAEGSRLTRESSSGSISCFLGDTEQNLPINPSYSSGANVGTHNDYEEFEKLGIYKTQTQQRWAKLLTSQWLEGEWHGLREAAVCVQCPKVLWDPLSGMGQ